ARPVMGAPRAPVRRLRAARRGRRHSDGDPLPGGYCPCGRAGRTLRPLGLGHQRGDVRGCLFGELPTRHDRGLHGDVLRGCSAVRRCTGLLTPALRDRMKADRATLPASPIRPALLDEVSTLGGAFTTLAERFPAW